jgi:2-dehydropantoate 2-reductase
VSVPVVPHPSDLTFTTDDVVLLAVKAQDTAAALGGLADAPSDVAIACLQNGVDSERQVLRRTPNTYAVPVMLPATYLEPGVVESSSAPITGILDVGRYPRGIDDRAEEISAAFATSTFSSRPQPEVMRFKWSKLLMNLGNSLEAAVGPIGRESELYSRARAEGEAAIAAAGIDCASMAEDAERRGDLITMRRVGGQRRGGGSTWQSLARGTGRVETDLLNGEIVLLGRLHGVPTPVNALLQAVGNELARNGAPPASLTEADLLARLG